MIMFLFNRRGWGGGEGKGEGGTPGNFWGGSVKRVFKS